MTHRKRLQCNRGQTIIGTSAVAYILYALVEKKHEKDADKFKDSRRKPGECMQELYSFSCVSIDIKVHPWRVQDQSPRRAS